MTDKISDAVIDEMLAWLEGVTPGPWNEGDKWVFVSPRSGNGFDALEDILRNEEGPKNVSHVARCTPETIRALLLELRAYRTAANPLQAVVDRFPGAKVKPLEWKAVNGEGVETYEAQSILAGYYRVFVDEDSASGAIFAEYATDPEHFCTTYAVSLGRFFDWDDAKRAVQENYAAIILSALETTPAPVSEITDEMRKALLVLQAIADGWDADSDGMGEFVRVNNPNYYPDNGADPYIVIDVRALTAAMGGE